MKKIQHRAFVACILALILCGGLGFFVFRWCTQGTKWASSPFNRHLYNTAGQLSSGNVLDRDGDVLSSEVNGKRTYFNDVTVRKATLHVVGDLQGNIGTGALNAFADKMTGFNLINGAFSAHSGSNLYLTVDAKLNVAAYHALNGRKGTVAIYNYRTGEILCLVSTPTYDPMDVPKDIATNDAYKGAYINRFLSSSFAPGSVFKTITVAAALEQIPNVQSKTWTCHHSVIINGQKITCTGNHGTQTLKEALANSCNVAFAEIADELGSDTLKSYTEKAGLMKSYSIDGIPTAKGSFDFDNLSKDELGWAGIGQYKDRVNPCSMMVYMGAIASGGSTTVPYLVSKIMSPLGFQKSIHVPHKTGMLISSATASTVAEMMANNVKQTYGTARFPNMDLCAKSGTAEVGSGKSPNAWFAGFLRNSDKPYAFVVMVENGGSGPSVAGTVAGKVLTAAVNAKEK